MDKKSGRSTELTTHSPYYQNVQRKNQRTTILINANAQAIEQFITLKGIAEKVGIDSEEALDS